ncbi:uncharacterized protein LOC129605277 isoform X2 [Condylostylus longicornis]|uniref:uncharacterized protein LOC129605277 isoform X2 n=1 Tax=Condylostylus longicornis TaxID=2530218 RepID=UPI00244DF3F6|nr:uncharacterized protein LOC129605277 isoform X2 [Condylostylus longicornis]
MSVKKMLLLTIFYIWTTSYEVNGYKTYNNRYTVASASSSASSSSDISSTDNDHPNDIILRENDAPFPMKELEKFNSISTLEELYEMLGEEQTDAPGDSLSELGLNLGRSAVQIPVQAKCEPRDTVVDIVPENSSRHRIYFPGCILVKRCSGCCIPRELKSCQPSSTSLLNYAVVVSDFDMKTGRTKLRPKREIVTVEQHDSCTCQCIVKAEDCGEFQKYDPINCQCICPNVDDKEKCEKDNEKIWVPQSCACRCRNQSVCTSGTFFDENICACKANRRNRIVSPVLVDPDTNTQYTIAG